MKAEHNRAFKEWAVACEAMREGRQILLIRKGGIREEGGAFTINDPEFFLMPTFEHQKEELLLPEYVSRLRAIQSDAHDPKTTTIDTYAVVDTILEARDDEQVLSVLYETLWNPTYVKLRFDFNPYDPLYLILLRVYRLPHSTTIPLRPDYIGCKSWVTLEHPLSTEGAVPALSDEDYTRRRTALLNRLNH